MFYPVRKHQLLIEGGVKVQSFLTGFTDKKVNRPRSRAEERGKLMSLKDYIPTGEVAKLLNISRSTVSRKFDSGDLQGKKNPITGERLISRKSLEAFMEKYNLPVKILIMEKKRVLLGTPDERIATLVDKIFSEDERIKVDRVSFGCDVLIKCSKEPPALLVIDEELPDIPTEKVIKSLRRMKEQKDLKILCCSRTLKTNRCLDWGADEALTKDGFNQDDLPNKLYSLLDLPQKGPKVNQPFEHKRRYPRVAVNLPVKIRAYRLSAPRLRDLGQATVENISCGGAYLSRLNMEKGYIPAEPFRFLLEVNQAPLKNWRAHCEVVRLWSNGSSAAGVQFVRLSKANLKTIEAIAQA
jgi:excisionase family DNA binding protein